MIGYTVFFKVLLLVILIFWGYKCYERFFLEASVHKLLDQVGLGYIRCRVSDSVILHANKGFIDIFELDADSRDVVGYSLKEFFVPIDPYDSLISAMTDKCPSGRVNLRVRTLKGKEKTVTFKICRLHHSRPVRQTALGIVEDITERAALSVSIRESRDKYEKLFRNSGDMVLLFDIFESDIQEANPAAETFTGFTLQELSAMSVEELIHPMERQKFSEMEKDLIFSGKAVLETVLVRKDGLYREALITATTIEVQNSKMAMAVIKDISSYSRKQQEEATRCRELEDFCKAAVEREERINELRKALEIASNRVKELERERNDREN